MVESLELFISMCASAFLDWVCMVSTCSLLWGAIPCIAYKQNHPVPITTSSQNGLVY